MTVLGEHGGYILAAYLAAVIGVGGLVVLVLRDYRTQKRRLADLEARGVRRHNRSAAPVADHLRPDWDTP